MHNNFLFTCIGLLIATVIAVGTCRKFATTIKTCEIEPPERIQNRLTNLKLHCGQYNNDNHMKREKENLIGSRSRKLLYCWNHKAASTKILEIFAGLEGFNASLGHRLTKYLKLPPEELNKAIHDWFAFTVVRHPWTRLVSSYRNRLANDKATWQAKKYVPKILEVTNATRLTFRKFVQFLTKTPVEEFDTHWMPFYRHCNPCGIKYDAILKAETLALDLNELFKIDINNIEKHSGEKLAKRYFKMLTNAEKSKLYAIYKPDFDLFNYSVW